MAGWCIEVVIGLTPRPKSRDCPPKVAKTTHGPTIEEHHPGTEEATQEVPEPECKEAAKLIPEDEDLTQINQSMETNESPPDAPPTNQKMSPKMDQSESDTTSEDKSLDGQNNDHRRAKSASPNREGEDSQEINVLPTSQETYS
ncbi:hypothetical protein DSO57_1036256 [Entomophthora muscae]|uniref:Uncharacterized protein n=1 Tax=Entomophthora muscae TaxID=34485 RepID=A0ACC2TXT8_9FUNG|nr:hypothetical protein DSO57_1036256 [Entomophthora muscae]